MYSIRAVLLLALIGMPVTAVADSGQTRPADQGKSTSDHVSLTNDTNNYSGDHLWWHQAIRAAKSPGGDYTYCIPANTFLIGLESTLESDTENATVSGSGNSQKNLKLTGQWLRVRLADLDFPWWWREQKNFQHAGSIAYVGSSNNAPAGAGSAETAESKANAPLLEAAKTQCSQFQDDTGTDAGGAPSSDPPARENSTSGGAATNGTTAGVAGQPSNPEPSSSTQFSNLATDQYAYVSADDLKYAYRAGWEYGALAVPFKLQTSQGGTITSSTSIGPYLGFRFPLTDSIVLSPVGFVGAAPISVSTTKNGASSTQQLAAISYGGGFVFTIKDSFQAGIIAGADHVNPNSNYPYNDKLWVSFALGYSFAR